jgi:hypothetical protein
MRLPILGRLVAALLLISSSASAQVDILTNRYDQARTGANLSETALTTANVNVNQFGKLYSYPVDGSVYAQPLYVRGVTINGTPRNVLYVATMNDKVYAFDADSSSPSPLWLRDFTNPPSVTPVPIGDIVAPNLNIVGIVGIQSTPVIDRATGTIYLVARTKEDGAYVQRLHALDIATGLSRPGSPVTITGSVSGTAPDSTSGPSGQVVTFNPKMQSQRAGLALSNGVVLIWCAGHEDMPQYHGWIMGYDAASLARVGIFCVTPDVYAGGIWQGGRAPAIDAAGNAYFATGNAAWDGVRKFGDTLLKLAVGPAGFTLLDYFTPGNEATLNSADDDLSGSGFTIVPGTNLLLGGGKEGVLYLVNGDNLGHKVANDTQIVQRIPETGGHVMGGPVFWSSATLGPMIYNWSEDDILRAYRFSGGRLTTPAYAQGTVASPGHPGGSLILSANGNRTGTGIVWASLGTNQDGIHGLVPGVLRAFNAETMNEIWSSERNPSRDRVGTLMKFVPPVVVDGKVFLPNHDNAVAVYGLIPDAPPPPPPASGVISINFQGSAPTGMGAAETAGVVAKANWNNAAGGSRSTPLPLMTDAGASSGASVTWSAPSGTWQLPTTDQAGNARMMKGYIDASASSTVSVTGLPQAAYDVYVYADGDNKSYERSAAYTIRGPGITTTTINLTDAANTNFSGAYVRADNSRGNYVRFSVSATSFTIEATPTAPASGTRRAPINGIQIVPTAAPPPPSPDFTIAASPSSRTITQGASTTYTVTTTAVNGFTGSVALSVGGLPAGATATFNPTSISGSGTSTLTVATSSGTPAGTSTLTINGANGSLQHRASVTLAVNVATPPPPSSGVISIDFAGSSPAAMAGTEIAGVVPKGNWNTAVGASRTTPLALADDSGAATAATVVWSAGGGIWMTPITDQPGNARMMKGYLDTGNTVTTTTVTVAGLAQAGYDVYVYVDGDNKGYERSAAYTISGPGIAETTVNLTDAANTNFGSTFTRAIDSAGNYVRFSITGTGFTLEATATLPVSGTRRAPVNGIQIVPTSPPPPAPDFTIAATPSSRTVTQGASASYTVTLGAQNGFSGSVSFSVSGAPAGTTTSFSPATVTGSGSTTMTVTTTGSTPAAASTLTIRGTSGSLSHSASVTLDVDAAPPPPPAVGAIGIDFLGSTTASLAPADIAGVVPKSHWNGAAGSSRTTPLALIDETGAATAATITWTANGGWMTPITDQGGNARLMKGYLDTNSTSTTTVTVAGLPSGAYDVYVYVDGDNHEFTRTAAYRLSGSGITATTINATDTAFTNFAGTFTQASGSAGNYVKFTITAAGFTLTATPVSGTNSTLRAPINAIQIVPR